MASADDDRAGPGRRDQRAYPVDELLTGTDTAAEHHRFGVDQCKDAHHPAGDELGGLVKGLPGGVEFRAAMNLIEDSAAQLAAVGEFFEALGARMDRLPVAVACTPSEDLAESDA